MGLLDDAIREHLELKRKHGASDEEIVRAEQEALAPARRDPASALAETGSPAAEADLKAAEPSPPPVDEPVYADEYAAEPAPADADEPLAPEPAVAEEAAPPPPPEPPSVESSPVETSAVDSVADDATRVREVVAFEEEDDALPPAPVGEDDPEPDEVPLEDQLSPGPDPYRARTSILDDPLDEASAPPPSQPPPEGEGQDVLEETPDFLQETPDHDKLWFEQKPPRDFDFD